MILSAIRLMLILFTALGIFLVTVRVGETWQQGYFALLGWLTLSLSVPLLALVQWVWWKKKHKTQSAAKRDSWVSKR